jgi:16S rRNA (guanine(966)-N(2))-methyltransferase RsmD
VRIIAGEFRHRQLFTPRDGTVTRPIPDRVKESLFSLLRGWTEDASVLDAFAGTGAIGLEAVSRGAARCVFIERDKRIAAILEKNVENLGCGDRCEVVRADALGTAALSRCPTPADLVFFDPPYPLVLDAAGWERVKLQCSRLLPLMNPRAFLVLRTPWPFRHPDAVAPEPGVNLGKQTESRKKQPEASEFEDAIELGDGRDFEEIQEFDDSDEQGALEEGSVTPWHTVDLAIPGAEGPETHVYGNSAIHLYMPGGRADATPPAEAR